MATGATPTRIVLKIEFFSAIRPQTGEVPYPNERPQTHVAASRDL